MSKIFKAITGIFKAPKIPKLDVSIPDPGSAASKLAAEKKVRQRKQAGREGTIYTGAGGAYTGANLGGTA